MSEAEGGWVLEIVFPRPYSIDKTVRNGGLVISVPFGTEQSAERALEEMQVNVRTVFRVVPGQVIRGGGDG